MDNMQLSTTSLLKASLASFGLLAVAISTPAAEAGTRYRNYGGGFCKVEEGSAASPSNAGYDFYGRICNNSSSQPLKVICHGIQTETKDKHIDYFVDYIMWNLNGLNGNQHQHPEQSLWCQAYTRTRYGTGYYYSGSPDHAADVSGYGATPTGLVMRVNKSLSNGFTLLRCQLPRKYNGKRSCISHFCYNEYN